MRKKQLFTVLTAFATACIVFAGATQLSAATVEIAETNFDFGYVHAGAVVSHSYVLHNRGADSLKILSVKPACGCTKAPLKKEVIATGDSGEVELVFTLSGSSQGHVAKTATVQTNDKDRETFQLQFGVEAYMKPDSIAPLTLSAGEIKFADPKNSKESKVVVKNVSNAPVKLHLVSTSDKFFTVDLPGAVIEPGKTKELKVRLANGLDVDEFKKSFTFELDDQATTRYTIPVELAKPGQASATQPASSH